MHLGLFSLMPQRDRNKSARRVYSEMAEQVKLAEAAGFEIAWFAEHHFSNYCLCPSPLNIAAYNLQHRFGDHGAAATAYQKAIAADPKFSWPYANLGSLYMELDQYDLAVDWLGSAIRINPNHFRAHANLGVALQTLRRYDEAVGAYRTALALNPDDASTLANLGRSLLSLGRDAEGLRALRTAVRLDPTLEEERELLTRRLAGGFRLD